MESLAYHKPVEISIYKFYDNHLIFHFHLENLTKLIPYQNALRSHIYPVSVICHSTECWISVAQKK